MMDHTEKTLLLFSCNMVLYKNITLNFHSSLLLHMSFLYSNILHRQDHYYILAALLHMEQIQWEKKSHGKTQGPPPKHTADHTS